MKHTYLVIILFTILFLDLKAQSPVIWTVSGEKIECVDIRDFQDTSLAEIQFVDLKNRNDLIDRQEVFSITYQNKTTYLYSPIFDDDRTLEQMKLFIEGNREGYLGSTTGSFFVGFASGLLAMSIPPDKLFFSPLIPFTAVVSIGVYSPFKEPSINDDHFLDGYQQRRKKQNVKSAVKGGIAGLAVGVLGSFLIYGWGL